MKSLGKIGEDLFQQQMEAKGYTVQNVSEDPQYYYKGDFIITSSTTGETKIFECKFDNKIDRTGNLYLEIVNKNSDQCIGWWERCSADYLAYGNAKTGRFLIVDMQELRERVDKLPKRMGFCGNDSAGYLVHISQIKDLIKSL